LKNQTDAVNKLFIFRFKAVDSFGLSFSKKQKESNCVLFAIQSIITSLIHGLLLLINRKELLNRKE